MRKWKKWEGGEVNKLVATINTHGYFVLNDFCTHFFDLFSLQVSSPPETTETCATVTLRSVHVCRDMEIRRYLQNIKIIDITYAKKLRVIKILNKNGWRVTFLFVYIDL